MCRVGENIYQRKDGRWEGRYMRGLKESGAIYYGYVYGRTRNAVRAKLLPLKQEYMFLIAEQGAFAGTLKEWLQQWLEEEIRPTVKPSTYAPYFGLINVVILPDQAAQTISITVTGTVTSAVNQSVLEKNMTAFAEDAGGVEALKKLSITIQTTENKDTKKSFKETISEVVRMNR